MQVELSEEMIEKITCVAFMRYQNLRIKIKETEKMVTKNETEKRFKAAQLRSLNKSLDEAAEVHSKFLALSNISEEE